MNHNRITAIAALSLTLAAHAETRRLDVTASFQQTVSAADVSLFPDGASTAVPCKGGVTDLHHLRCSADLNAAPQFVRVEIRARGFKLYSRNFPHLSAQRKAIPLNLGNVPLKPTDIQVVQATTSLTSKDERLYEITLQNDLKRKVEATEVSIEGVLAGNKGGCLVEAPNRYTVDDTLHMAVDSPAIGGSVRVTKDGETLTQRLTGTLVTETCKQNAHLDLRLQLPVSFTISDSDFTAIRIALPKTLRIAADPGTPPWAKRQEIPVDAFPLLTFVVRTNSADVPEVVATYDVKRERLVKIF